MNTLDVQEVLDALDEIVERKLHDQAQLERLQASIQKIIHLDSLQGEGGEAIKDHFATLHLPVLAAFQLFIGQYIEQLKQIRSNLLNFESSSALIREEFLADVKNGLDRVERYAIEDATAIESIRASIADLLPLPPFSMEPVLRYAQQGKDHVRVTAERLGNLDEANETVLASAKSTLQELTTVVSQVANWTSGGVIASPETQAEINANMEELYQNVVTQALQMAPLDRSHVEGREGDLYQDVLPLEFLYTGAYAPLYGSLKAANWYYLNHFPVSAILSNEQALQACRAPAMGETHAVTPAYFPLFARLSTLPANATVSPAILTRQLKQLVPIQYQWYQAQLRTQAIQTDTSQVVTIPGYMFTDQEVAAINTYLENNPPNEERLNENPIVTGVVDFFFGDFLTLADPEASLGEKALATTFILVKPAKVGEVVYDLSKARKVKTGGKGNVLDNGTAWGNIKITQPFYEGTKIPKSFELAVGGEKFWVHPNGTKHMVEYITRNATTHGMPINSQTLLSSFQSSVKSAVQKGIKYEEIMNIGNWELVFSKPRGDGLLPVIKHAVYKP
ncbi:LXG domain-containing protein [Shouchella clausii]|uniref:LXG domain-containing protein n=1 Tax=Shouchella clausii TaxID=79880 RepID=UPI0026F43A58|nr:LXG domain-containing protein [Shouchella clausii]MDO7285276.1 LXG domain-containing protein [Shouchella clausii]MDO7305371.1 LXG domain-containing protein [Shouchella clausii]